MKQLVKYSYILLCLGMAGFTFADAPVVSSSPINTDLSTYSDSSMPVTAGATVTAQTQLVNKVQQLQQTVSSLQDRVTVQDHIIQELQLRLQAVEIALGQTPENQNASLSTQKKNPVVINDIGQPTALPVPQTPVAASANDATDQQKLYQSAQTQIQQQNYTAAASLLQQYVQKYPNGSSAADAHYWLGELYAIDGNNQQAHKEFLLVTNQYAQSGTAANAMLKLGTIAYSTAQYPEAKNWFAKVVQHYPQSSAAQSASTQLQLLKKAGY